MDPEAGSKGSVARSDGPSRPALLALHAVLVGAIALLAAQILLQAGNTLHHNGRWTSGKMQLERGVVGAVATFVTRPPLRRNRLDLGEYFGFQQLLHSETGEIDRLEFSFSGEKPCYLDVLFGADPRALDGVRLSRHPEFRSLRFASTPEGEFVESQEIELGDRLEDGWNRVRLRFQPEGVRIEINEAPPLAARRRPGKVHSTGFRGSRNGALVDDVEIGFADGAPPLIESFANRRGRARWVGIAVLVTAGLAALAHIALRHFAGFEALPAHLGCFTGYLVILVGLAAYWAVDYFHFSGLHPDGSQSMQAAGYPNRIEDMEAAARRIHEEIDGIARDERFRILLIGTSQTWGAGVLRSEDAWGRVLERELDERLSAGGRRFAVVNTAISGMESPWLLKAYRRDWQRAEPDLVIVDLGHNDRSGPAFEAALRGFVETDRARGIPTVFIPEPNALEESIQPRLQRNHQIMRRVARDLGVPVIDAQGWLHHERESGFLWWDRVHLTSYGHRLLGEYVASELVPILRSLPSGPDGLSRSGGSRPSSAGRSRSSSRAGLRGSPSFAAGR